MSANVGESYNEQILQATIDGEPYVNENPYPSRIEVLLMELKEAIEQGGGGAIDTTVNGTSENAVQNKAIYNYVNSSVSTNTADFIGTFNSIDALEAYSGTVTNNDYAFVVGTDSDGNTVYNRYKYNSEIETWSFEYALNNSSFTAAQWAAINSGLTSSDKTKIDELGAASTKGFDAEPTSGHTDYAVSSDGVYQALSSINTCVMVENTTAGSSREVTYQIKNNDFLRDDVSGSNGCGTYLIFIVTWSTTPSFSLYAVSFSGGNENNTNVTKIAGADATVSTTQNPSTIHVTSSGKVLIYAMR